MAVIENNITESTNVRGFEKQIHETSRTMMLDNLQAHMYMRPIKSCVRECVSNSVDSTKEKLAAIEILSGRKKVSDYYVDKKEIFTGQAKDDIYSDSEFNKDYYDLKYLSADSKITLTYTNNTSSKRDQLTIVDNGVGLGGLRLEGFFNLGFSSKRLTANELGGFG